MKRKFFVATAMFLILALGMISCKKIAAENAELTTLKNKLQSSTPMGGTSLTVPVGGNAYVTTLATGGTESVTNTALTNWTNPNSIFSAYFRLGTLGSLTVKIKATVPSGSSVIKVTINGTSFNVNVTGASSTTYNVGTVNVTAPGYVRVNFQGLSKTGSNYAEISDLVISGTAVASNVIFANDPANFYWERRGAAPSLNFTAPSNTEWFYSEITVPTGQDAMSSFFMANGFAGGYFGMQVNTPTRRSVLFSLWDPAVGKTTLVQKGDNVEYNAFGDEGTGAAGALTYNWVAGNTYRFLTRGKPDGLGSTLYSSYFYAPEVGAWKFMGTFKRPNTNSYLTGLNSFLENFSDSNGYLGRKAIYGNQWARNSSGTWSELTTASYGGGHDARKDYAGGLLGGQFYMQTGGYFADFVETGVNFTKSASGSAPTIDFTTLPVGTPNTDLPNGTYKIITALNNTSLLEAAGGGVTDGTFVQLYTNTSPTVSHQQWVITHVGSGYYKLQPVNAPGKVMDVSGGSTAAGTQIQIYTDNSSAAQKWKIINVGGDYYTLSPGNATSLVLDLNNAGTSNGTKVQVYTSNGSAAQKFKFLLQ
ncbi:DUF5077 domain-containing protein [Pedobacter sp. ISL-68]|uniref:DUF3472 domain-containing protein n=1 Tax=unclassified Pedobacter TaxID=2628915 RepID=UPI001BE6D05B|nr:MULTISPECIES: DUF5077 domain-containing protein [unclassified Pedobacter]MBT2563125.1 DUF5077 domain-containing protein [Pedobacter sp. ISL-64]MBT2593463.1 DUF5077 domain-containing protein [Pedobacter sp. ISL-68]